MNIMVTGVNGFVGNHLTDALKAAGHEVVGVGIVECNEDLLAKLESFHVCDLTNPDEVAKLPLQNLNGVINLAGLAAVGPSFDNPDEYMRINTAVLSVICDEILKQNLQSKIRVLAISSGALYANNQAMPLTEDSTTDESSSPYAASKLAMEQLAQQYSQKGLECIVARPFNHIGPGQGPGFLLPDLYTQLLEAQEKNEPMRVGNLTTQRDYTDVRDVVGAYVALISAPSLSHQLYNVCSGASRKGEEVLETLMRVTDAKAEVQVDESKFRPSDAPILYGDRSRLTTDTDWQPKIPFEQTVSDYVAWQSN